MTTDDSTEDLEYKANLTRVKMPDLDEVTGQEYDFEENIHDYESMEEVSRALNNARLALFKINERINQYDRAAAAAKLKYDRVYRRYYLSGAGIKPESERKLRAELKSEKFEDEFIVNQQYKDELNRTANALRIELSALQAISNNVRAQVRFA